MPAGERLFFWNGLQPETVALAHPPKVSSAQSEIVHALKFRVIAFPLKLFFLGLHGLLGDKAGTGLRSRRR